MSRRSTAVKTALTVAAIFLATFGLVASARADQPPPVPQNLRVIASTATSVTLAWDVPSDVTDDIVGYNVYMDAAKVVQTANTTATITGLTPGTSYSFVVTAVSRLGLEGARSAALTFKMGVPRDTQPPTVPTNGTSDWGGCGGGKTSAVISWGPSFDEPGGSGLKGYYVSREDAADQFVPADAGETLTLTGLGPEGPGLVFVTAVDNADNRSSALTIFPVVADCWPPTKPTGLQGIPTVTTVTLSWTPSTAPDGGIKEYRVYRNGILSNVVTGLSAQVTGLTPATAYKFAVSAVSTSGIESPKSDEITVTTITEDPLPTGHHRYALAGAATLKTLTTGSLPLRGTVEADLEASTGRFTAALALNQTSGRLTTLGFLPVTAKVGFVPSGAATGSLQNGVLNTSSKVRIKIQELKLFGAIPLTGGNSCQTKQLSDINLSGGFSAASGGTLAGTFKISDLNGCGAFNGIVSPLAAGGGNTISLALTPALSVPLS